MRRHDAVWHWLGFALWICCLAGSFPFSSVAAIIVQNGDHIIRGRDACDTASGPVLRQCRRRAPGYVPTSARATLLSVVAIIVQNDPEGPCSYSRVITEVIEAGGVPLLAKLPKTTHLPTVQFRAVWTLANVAAGTARPSVAAASSAPLWARLEQQRPQLAWASFTTSRRPPWRYSRHP
jgi:hypothetical protein